MLVSVIWKITSLKSERNGQCFGKMRSVNVLFIRDRRGLTVSVEKDPRASPYWNSCSEQISHYINRIFLEIRNLLLLDPDRTFFIKDSVSSKETPLFRAWNGSQRFLEHSMFQSESPRRFSDAIFRAAGINAREINTKSSAIVNLYDFNVSTIRQGAFLVQLTNDPSLHLRFADVDGMRPTLYILDTHTALMLGFLDLTGLTG